MFSYTPSPRSSLQVTDQDSQLHKTIDKVIDFLVAVFEVLKIRWEDIKL